MEVVEIKINRHKDVIYGIKIFENESWVVINENPSDYVLDGYKFIYKKYIKYINILDEEEIKQIILNSKFKPDTTNYINNIPIYDLKELLIYLRETKELIEFSLDTDEYILVGKVVDVFDKSFLLEEISTKGEVLRRENIKSKVIRSIGIKTDYLNSLELYKELSRRE